MLSRSNVGINGRSNIMKYYHVPQISFLQVKIVDIITTSPNVEPYEEDVLWDAIDITP